MAANRTIIEADISLGPSHLYVVCFTPSTSYPTGGEPVDADGNERFDRLLFPAASGFVWEFIPATQLLKAYSRPGHTHDLLIKGGQAASTTNDLAYYATDILGKEQAADKTIAGADSATKGGVVSVAAGALVEVANATDLHAVVLYGIGVGR